MDAHDPGAREILVISRCSLAFGESQGGADVLARRHAAALARSGFSVSYVASGATPLPGGAHVEIVPPSHFLASRSSAGNLNPLYLLNELFNVIRGALRGSRVLRTHRFDLVVTNHSVATLLIRLRHRRQPVFHYIHDSLHAHRSTRRWGGKLLRFFLNDVLEVLAARFADRSICASLGIMEQLWGFGLPASQTVTVAPLVRSVSEKAAEPRPLVLLSNLAASAPYILSVGQQSGRKRFDVLIKAMKWVPRDVQLVLVGDGPAHETYRSLAAQEQLTDRVHFLRGVTDDELTYLYSGTRLFALVSENEGFPVTVAEAMAMGRRAIVASPAASSWTPDAEHRLQLVARIPLPEELGREITKTLAAPELGPVRRRTRRLVAPSRFSSESDVVSLYSELLSFPMRWARP
jgi:glycosyltransferase involved in cell wall biosynthesis